MRLLAYTLKRTKGGSAVAVANDIERGLIDREAVQVVRGIKAGDLLVVRGQRWLRDGEAVEVVEQHEGSWPW